MLQFIARIINIGLIFLFIFVVCSLYLRRFYPYTYQKLTKNWQFQVKSWENPAFLDENLMTKDSSLQDFTYTFRDQRNQKVTWSWQVPKNLLAQIQQSYGLPIDFYEPYYPYPEVLAERNTIMQNACFKERQEYIVPDYIMMVKKNRAIVKPIYDLIVKHLGSNTSLDAKIDLALKFCQDIPYKIPPDTLNGKLTGGVLPPAIALQFGYGDCDTKCVLFAAILSYEPRIKTAFLFAPQHLLVGVNGVPKSYQRYISFGGMMYLLCEPVGPMRAPIGESNTNPIQRIEPSS